jgi:hypothetical protein
MFSAGAEPGITSNSQWALWSRKKGEEGLKRAVKSDSVGFGKAARRSDVNYREVLGQGPISFLGMRVFRSRQFL